MRARKSVALGLSAALAVSGISIIAAGAAQASSNTVGALYSQLNNNGLGGVGANGAKNVSLTVSPTSTLPGTPIEVTVGSSDLTFTNGPATQANTGSEEIDAVIQIGSANYTLRGPNTAGCVATNGVLHSAGWSVSSTSGNSSSTTPVTTNVASGSNTCPTTGSQAGTTGIGATAQGVENTPVSLLSPATPGSYTIKLKALVLNSVIGSGTPLLDDGFDNILNIDAGNGTTCAPPGTACADGSVGPGGVPSSANGAGSFYNDISAQYISNAAGWTPVTLDVTSPPSAAVASAQNLGSDNAVGGTGTAADTTLTLGASGVPYVRSQDVLNVTGNNAWTPSKQYTGSQVSTFFCAAASGPPSNCIGATEMGLSLCPSASTAPFDTAQGCAPAVAFFKTPSATAGGTKTAAGAISTDAAGQLQPFSVQLSSVTQTGNYDIWVVLCDSSVCNTAANVTQSARISVKLLGDRLLSTTATTVGVTMPTAVTGSNFYPGESVSIVGAKAQSALVTPITETTASCSNGSATVTVTAAGHGLVNGSYVRIAGTTNGGGVNYRNAKVAGSGANTFNFADPELVCGPNGVLIASAADTGTITPVPGTPSASDTPSTLTASSTGTISGSVGITDVTDDEFLATALANGGTTTQNYAETSTFAVDTTAPTGAATLNSTTGWSGHSPTLSLSAVADDHSNAAAVVATVTWGDGSAAVVLGPGGTSAHHVFTAAGAHPVTVTLTDELGNVSAPIAAGTFTVTTPGGTFTKSTSSRYLTQSMSLKPTGVTSDVASLSINWGDGKTTSNASKTVATSHTYTTAGSFQIVVTLRHANSSTIAKSVTGKVAVVKDTYKPVPTLTVPSKSSTGSSWKTIKGKVTDKGLGAKSVTVRLVEKRGSAYYAWTGTKWVKKSTKAKALAAAKKIVDTTVSAGWSVKGATAPKGTLYVTYYATDKANNSSTSKTYTKSITK